MRSFNVVKFRPAKHVVFRISLSQAAAAIRSRVRRTHGGAVPADYLVHGGALSAPGAPGGAAVPTPVNGAPRLPSHQIVAPEELIKSRANTSASARLLRESRS